jgi:hypothetical protein
MKLLRYIAIFCLLITGAIYLQSCAGVAVNFTGGRLPPDKYQTITIQNFFNDTPEGPANLGINFTERMKEYYQRNTPLKLLPESQQLDLGGSIVGYGVSPVAPGGGDINQQAQLQRLTITVKVEYTDYVNDTKTFTKSFSFFKDFGAEQTLISVEAEFIEEIFDQIVFDIFNATYANW